MSVWDRLDEIQARADKATDGPWDWDSDLVFPDGVRPPLVFAEGWVGYPVDDAMEHPLPTTSEDAEFIAHARTDVPALGAALRAVLDLHKAISEEGFDVDVCERCSSTAGEDVAVSWPCLTVRVIENTLEENR